MRSLLLGAILAIVAGTTVYAQDPAPKPDPNAEHPPTNRMEQTTPEMKAPDGAQHAPTNRVGESVPPMKATDPQRADTRTTTGTGSLVATEEWVGRSVYSSDNRQLGEVAKLSGSDIYVDIGGLLGIGETRALIKPDQIQEVQEDRIVLKLSEAEAKNLPAAEEEKPATTPPQ